MGAVGRATLILKIAKFQTYYQVLEEVEPLVLHVNTSGGVDYTSFIPCPRASHVAERALHRKRKLEFFSRIIAWISNKFDWEVPSPKAFQMCSFQVPQPPGGSGTMRPFVQCTKCTYKCRQFPGKVWIKTIFCITAQWPIWEIESLLELCLDWEFVHDLWSLDWEFSWLMEPGTRFFVNKKAETVVVNPELLLGRFLRW